jgi:hypothetical protein
MRCFKRFGLIAVVSMGVMVSTASPASATHLWSKSWEGWTYILAPASQIKASLSGTATLTTTEGTVLDTCSGGEVNGSTTNSGSATETVKGNITALTWTNCTEPTATTKLGGLEIHYTSGLNGTLTAGAASEVTVNTTFFGSCVFTIPTGGTIGTLTGSTSTNATFDINAVAKRVSGLCPETTRWVGTYKVTSPSPLWVNT